MHRPRGGKIFSLSRRIQVRTNATATKQAVSARIHSPTRTVVHIPTHCFTQVSAQTSGWGIPNSRPTAPPSPFATSTPAGLGKWAPPISKWAKPESQKPPTKAGSQDRPFPQRRNPQTSLPPNRGLRPKPSVSLVPPRGASAPGKWSRPPGFALPPHALLTSAEPAVHESVAYQPEVSKVEERSSRTNLRGEQEPKIGEPSRSFLQSQGDEFTARQNRRWEGNAKHKPRGSLLHRREDNVISRQPRDQDMKTNPRPKIQKAKKLLRVNPDIIIPSTVSVGNFARLLNVSLSKDFKSSSCGYR